MSTIEVPYLSDEGTPIHMANQGIQRGYMQGLTGEESNDILQHANGLAQVIHGLRQERAECKRKAREMMRIPEGSSNALRTQRLEQLLALKVYYDALAEHIDVLKATKYIKDDKGLAIPRQPKGPVKPK